MALVVPNPTVPTNGQALDATPLLQNLNAVYQAIQNFDASQVQAGTLAAAAFNANINPNTLLKETESPFVASGLTWSTVSGLNGTMTGGTAYIGNSSSIFRVIVNAVGSNTFAASKDIYIDVDVNGNITYNAVTNGAAAPALTTNSIRIAKVVTGAASITSITQYGFDSNGVTIYPQSSTKVFKASVDANGWERYDFGTFQQYRKKNSFSASLGASAFAAQGSDNLPVGMSSIGNNFVECDVTATDPAIRINMINGVASGSTSITFGVTNTYSGGTVNYTANYSICITTP